MSSEPYMHPETLHDRVKWTTSKATVTVSEIEDIQQNSKRTSVFWLPSLVATNECSHETGCFSGLNSVKSLFERLLSYVGWRREDRKMSNLLTSRQAEELYVDSIPVCGLVLIAG